MNIYEKLSIVQSELKAKKGRYNDYSNFYYRSAEDILEAVKPVLKEHGLTQVLSDEIVFVEGRFYIKATVVLFDIESEATLSATAFAREPESKKGFDESQLTGSASSYARKYALNGMYSIDDIADADTQDNRLEGHKKPSETATGKRKSTGEKPVVKGKYTKNDVLAAGYSKGMSKAEILNLWKVKYGTKANSNDGTQAEGVMEEIEKIEDDFSGTPFEKEK